MAPCQTAPASGRSPHTSPSATTDERRPARSITTTGVSRPPDQGACISGVHHASVSAPGPCSRGEYSYRGSGRAAISMPRRTARPYVRRLISASIEKPVAAYADDLAHTHDHSLVCDLHCSAPRPSRSHLRISRVSQAQIDIPRRRLAAEVGTPRGAGREASSCGAASRRRPARAWRDRLMPPRYLRSTRAR